MANQRHVDMLLADGVEVWNLWRREEPGVIPDLRDANLSGANLIEANLSNADLRGADLRGARLGGAILQEAHLGGANLSEADLYGALCLGTRFSGATLTSCNVYGISAWGVDLEGAVQADLRITPPEQETTITVAVVVLGCYYKGVVDVGPASAESLLLPPAIPLITHRACRAARCCPDGVPNTAAA